MLRKSLLTTCLTLLLTSGGVANAALATYSGALNGSSSDPYPGNLLPLAYDGSISLAKFDPSLGTLNSVTLDLTSIFNFATKFENKSPNSDSTVNKIIDQQLTIGGNLLDTGKVTYSKTWVTGKYDGTIDYAGTSGFTVAESSGQTTRKLTLTGAAISSYIGAGSLQLDVHSHAAFSGGFTGGNGSFMNTQDYAATANVTYDYTPTPIPAAAWLLGSGLLGLLGIKRKNG